MDLTETLFQYELKTNKYGKLFFRIYPDDKKEEYLLEFTDKDKDEKIYLKNFFLSFMSELVIIIFYLKILIHHS